MKISRAYIQRLKHASVSEVAYRLRQFVLHRRLKKKIHNSGFSLIPHDVTSGDIDSLQMPKISLDNSPANGHYFDSKEVCQFENKWHHSFFADVKVFNSDPDIRTVWEASRLQTKALHLIWPGEDQSEQQNGKEAIIEWIWRNSFLQGPNYMSAMECGLRVPVFFYCLKYANKISDEERNVLFRAIYEHAWWIKRNLSLFTSLGNHTVCECVGLVFAGALFRNVEEGRKWFETGYQLLEQELTHQVLSDGGPAEQSITYHRFVLDLYWLAVDFLERNKLYDCGKWKKRLFHGENFLATYQNGNGLFPSIGDSDDGHAIARGLQPKRESGQRPKDGIKTFPESGYTVIRSTDELLFAFDHGPLGMAPLYNHGHADALSFTLSIHGKPIFVDPGTYRYNNVPDWRRYFKGTRAHNTVTIDGQDQAIQETGIIWSKPYTCKVIARKENSDGFYIKACHDGYRRLRKPVWHFRALALFSNEGFVLRDTFKGDSQHHFELNFHCHPDIQIEMVNDYWVISNKNSKIFIFSITGHTFSAETGLENPPFGWFSPAYGLKEPCTVLSCRKESFPRELEFLTAIWLKKPPENNVLRERLSDFEQQIAHT